MTTEELQLRRTVVCASGLLYWGGVLVHARRVRKQIGRSPNVRPRGAKERVLWLGWFLVIVTWVGQPLLLVRSTMSTPGLGLLAGLLKPAGLALGLALVTFGYAGTLWTYRAMGSNWRMGVNAQERTALVCRGPFKWVRHPIYVMQVLMLIGTALLLPTPLSFVMVAIHYVCVRLKARDEERYLAQVHGPIYRDYASQTGKFIPRSIGKRAAAVNKVDN